MGKQGSSSYPARSSGWRSSNHQWQQWQGRGYGHWRSDAGGGSRQYGSAEVLEWRLQQVEEQMADSGRSRRRSRDRKHRRRSPSSSTNSSSSSSSDSERRRGRKDKKSKKGKK
ncbi:unnamed protein product [Prorocentrum cordatum]|uniref:ADP-ribosylation factor-like protein 6-interacting protein 4 n=1 Tax=Prorocentrum cordatum TaxID=2364126 RepID=A0ABN9QD96_9DINO|nr:unnamed protein product [Polarella glacialis]